MVPEGWSRGHISDICRLQNGRGFRPPEWDTKGLPIIRIQNLNGNVKFNYYSGEIEEKWTVDPGQMLFAWAGTKGVSFGPTIWSGPRGVLNQHIFKVFEADKIDKVWLYKTLQHVTAQIESRAHGFKATLVHVKKSEIDGLPILIPPFAEQKKIAAVLSTWDKAIDVIKKLVENSKAQKKSLMQQLLSGKVHLSGFTSERDWREVRLSELVEIDTTSLGKKTAPHFTFQYISLSDVEKGQISDNLVQLKYSEAPSRARRVLKTGDILMATVRPNLEAFAMVSNEYSECIASTGFAVLTARENCSNDYLFHYLFSDHVRSQLYGMVVGSNYPAINSSDVKSLRIKCPAYEEQARIAEVLNTANLKISTLNSSLTRLKSEKSALMQQLLTGKRRVTIKETEDG